MGRHFFSFLKVYLCFELLHIFVCLGDVFLFVNPYKGSSELAQRWELPGHSGGKERRGRKLRFSVIFLCQFRHPTACGGRGLSQSWAPSIGSCISPEDVWICIKCWLELPCPYLFLAHFPRWELAAYMVPQETCPAKGRTTVRIAAGSWLCGPESPIQITLLFHWPVPVGCANCEIGPPVGPRIVPLTVLGRLLICSKNMRW